MQLEKHLLEQYADLLKERQDIKERIRKIEKRLDMMEKGGYQVADSVTCGKRGKKPLATKKIIGFPFPEWDALQLRLKCQKGMLVAAERKLKEDIEQVEKFIQDVPDSRMRRILRYRYIDGQSWVQVAHRMGGRHTADSCRNSVDRFLGKRK